MNIINFKLANCSERTLHIPKIDLFNETRSFIRVFWFSSNLCGICPISCVASDYNMAKAVQLLARLEYIPLK